MEGAERTMNATFADIHAAADYIGPGAVEVPLYQTEIFDICRRSSAFGQRIKQVPATGHPSRFFEETAIPNPGTAGFVNPRSINPTVVSPTRIELSVPLKAIVAQINYNLFDIELGDQQKQFAYLQAKDLVDTVSGVMVAHDVALWNGNDTSLSAPTTTQYMGCAAQIAAGGNSVTVTTSMKIVDTMKTTVAQMVANNGYHVRPTAIYANPVLLDLIDQEMKSEYNVVLNTDQITGGFRVKMLSTQAGDLPLIPDWSLALHGHAGNGQRRASGLHRDRGSDRVSLAGRSDAAHLPAWAAELADLPVCRGQVRRAGGEGRELCALSGAGGSVRRTVHSSQFAVRSSGLARNIADCLGRGAADCELELRTDNYELRTKNSHGRTCDGISRASGLPELRIAGWNHGGLDHGRDGADQQLLQAAGSECDSVHGAPARNGRGADRAAELSAAGAAGAGDNADREHGGPVRKAAGAGRFRRSR